MNTTLKRSFLATALILTPLISTSVGAKPKGKVQTVVLDAVKDTTVVKAQPNRNEGGSQVLFMRKGHRDRVMVAFNPWLIAKTLDGMELQSAKLELTVVNNGQDWPKKPMALYSHRVLRWWGEGNGWNHFTHGDPATKGNGIGATWNCPWDTIIQNDKKDCSLSSWTLGFIWLKWGWYSPLSYYAGASASTSMGNGTAGAVTFDVTKDIAELTKFNAKWNKWWWVKWMKWGGYGWMIRKQVESGKGSVHFAARTYPTGKPRLILTFVDPNGSGEPPVVTVPKVAVAPSGKLDLTGFVTDPDSISWTATIDFGDGNAKNVGVGSTKSFGIKHTYDTQGAFTVSVLVKDAEGGLGQGIIDVQVPELPPIVELSGDSATNEGTSIELDITVSMKAPEGIVATVDYGDGAVEHVALTTTGRAVVSHIFADDGVYPVTVTVPGPGGLGSETHDVEVANVAPSAAVTGNGTVSLGDTYHDIATISDPGADTHTATIDWGFGPEPVSSAGAGKLLIQRTFTVAAGAGVFSGQLTVIDDDGGVGTAVVSVTVLQPPPAVDAGPDVMTTEGTPLTIVGWTDGTGASVAEVVIGDGEHLEVPVAADGTITVAHTFADDGSYPVQFTVAGLDGDGTDTTLVTVANVPPVLSIDSPLEVAVDVGEPVTITGSFADPGADDWWGSVDWAEGVGAKGMVLTADKTFTATHAWFVGGTFTVELGVSDGDGGFGTAMVVVQVTDPPPVVDAGPDGKTDEGASFALSAVAQLSAGGGDVEVDWGDGSEPELASAGADGAIAVDHIYADDGTYLVTVVAFGTGGISSDTAEVVVSNVEPTVAPVAAQSVVAGELLEVLTSFDDPGADTWTATIDWQDDVGQVPLEIGEGGALVASTAYAGAGTFTATIVVSDDDGGVGTTSFVVTVLAPPPMVEAGEDLVGLEGATLTGTAWSWEPTGYPMTTTINYGDGSAPVVVAPDFAGAIQLSHAYADDGAYAVTVTVTSDAGETSDQVVAVVENVSPVLSLPDAAALGVLEPLGRLGVFADPGKDTWTVTADWGDGAGEDLPFSQQKVFGLDHAYAMPGEYTVSVTVTDDDGGAASGSFQVLVTAPPPSLEVAGSGVSDEGSPLTTTATIASFDGDALTASVDWADGTSEDVAIAEDGGVTLTHTYADDGTYTAVVAAVGAGGLAAREIDIVVANVAPSATITLSEQGVVGHAVALGGLVTDPGADTHSAVIDWGDGTVEPTVPVDAGSFTSSHAYAAPGTYNLSVTVTDDDGGQVVVDLSLGVVLPLPVVTSGNDVAMDEGQLYVATAAAVSPLGEPLAVTVDYGDGDGAEAVEVSPTGEIALAHTYLDDGLFTVAVTAESESGSVIETHTVSVANVSPAVDAGGDGAAYVGGMHSVTGSFTDPGADSWTAMVEWGDGSTEPVFLSGKTFDIAHVFGAAASYSVTVTVTDDDGGVGSDTFAVVVTNALPLVSAGEGAELLEGGTYVGAATVSSPIGEPLTATVDHGDGAGPQPVEIGDGGAIVTDHLYADDGAFLLEVAASGEGGTTVASVSVVVQNVAPEVTLGDDVIITVGDGFASTGAFTDPGADTHTISVDFGDGASGTAESADGVFGFDHLYGAAGAYTVTVTVTDDDGGVGTATMTVKVANPAPTISLGDPMLIAEGTTLIASGSFEGGEPGPFVATVDWADGSPVQALEIKPGGGFDLLHLYKDDSGEGIYPVSVMVENGDGAVGVSTLALTVNNIAPIIDLGENVVVDLGETFAIAGSWADPGADVLAATVDYGEGDGPVALTLKPNGTFDLSRDYAARGYYAVTVTADDGDGGVGAHTILVSVGNDPLIVEVSDAITAGEGTPQSFEGSATDTGMPVVSSVIDWGEGDGEVPLELGAGGLIVLEHTWPDEGTYQVVVTVTDAFGNVGVDVFDVTVENVAPVVSLGEDLIQPLGESVSIVGSFTDPGADSWTATVSWGDGTEPEALTLNEDKTFTLDRTYTGSGTYTITVTVTDDDAAEGSDDLVVSVPNEAPVVSLDASEITIDEGEALAMPGAFTDPGTDSWGALVDYGDGLDPVTVTLEDDKTFVLSHAFTDDGDYTVTITITDSSAAEGSQSMVVHVQNVAPAVDAGLPQTLAEGGAFTGLAHLSDPAEDDALTASVDWGDGSEAVDVKVGADRSIKLNHTYADDGIYTVTITASDDDGGVGVGTVTATVDNVSPLVFAGPHATVTTSETFARTTSFADPGSDTWTATVDYGDGGGAETVAIGPESTIELSHDYTVDGIYAVTLTVTDDDGGVGVAGFNVNAGTVIPVVSADATLAIDEGSDLTGNGSFTDVESESWTATVDYGDGSGVQALTLTAGKSFALSHTYADNGDYPVTIAVTDDDGGVGTKTLNASVANVPPTFDIGPNVGMDEGTVFKTVRTLTDPGADTWTGTVDYGDGSEPLGIKVGDEGEFKLQHAYVDDGTYLCVVTLTDDDGVATTETVEIVVSNKVPLVTAGKDVAIDEGSTFAPEDMGTFSDPGADEWTATVDYGDGEGPQPLVLNEDKTFLLNHPYIDNGDYTVTVEVTDDDGGVGVDTLVVAVANVDPVVALGDDLNADGGGAFTREGSFTDPGADTWDTLVDWGDGSPVEAVSATPDKTFELAHGYATNGTYVVTVTVTDDDGGVGTDELVVTVNNVAPVVTVEDGTATEGTQATVSGSFDDPGVGPWSGTIDFGDGSPAEELELEEDKTFTHAHAWPEDGSYVVTVSITDDLALVGTSTAVATVDNAVPVISLGSAAVFDDGVLERAGSFSDPGADTWTATVDFGDGTGVFALALEEDKTFQLSHVYANPGTFVVTVVITDDDGGEGVAIIEANNCKPPEGYTKWWVGGDASAPSDWANGANWSPVGIPAKSDSVFVCGSVGDHPVLATDVVLGRILIASGGTLDVQDFTLTVGGDVAAGGGIFGGEYGTVVMTGASAKLTGESVPNLVVRGETITLTTPVTATGDVTVFANKRLVLAGHPMDVLGDFLIKNNGQLGVHHLVLDKPTDRLLIGGDALLGGGSKLTDGVLEVKGDLQQLFTGHSLQPTGTLVELTGDTVQEVTFKSTSSSWLDDVLIDNPAGVVFATSVTVTGGLTLAPEAVLSQTDTYRVFYTTKLPNITAGDYQVRTSTVSGDMTLNEDVNLPNPTNDLVIASASSLTINSRTVTVGGNLSVSNSLSADPHLVMTSTQDKIFVGGDLYAGGRTKLYAGELHLRGNVAQVFNAEALQPLGTAFVFDGTAPQTIFLAHPAFGDSDLGDVALENAAGVSLLSDLRVTGALTSSGGVTALLFGSGHTLEVTGGVDVDDLIVDRVDLVLSGGDWTRFDRVTFQGYAPTDDRLTLVHSGEQAVFTELTFSDVPTTGRWIHATDTDGATTVAAVTIATSQPAYGLPRTTAVGGFVINWGAAADDGDGDGFTDATEIELGTSPIDATSAPVSFQDPATLSSPGGPVALVAMDLDGDGRADVATVGETSGQLTIQLQLGGAPGTFDALAPVAVGSGPVALAGAELTGDTLTDLVVVSNGDDRLTVVQQTAPGVFVALPPVTLPGTPSDVVAADLDGANGADLVVTLQDLDQVYVALRNGSGTFDAPVQYAVGAAPSAVTVADVDGDGRLDLITADEAAGTVSVLRQSPAAAGSFTAAVSHPVGAGPVDVAVGDLDADDRADIVAISSSGDQVVVLFQLADAPATFAAAVTTGASASPTSVTLCDLDADGAQDVVTTSAASAVIGMHLASGGATPSGLHAEAILSAGAGASSVACTPMGATGADALFAANATAGTVTVYAP